MSLYAGMQAMYKNQETSDIHIFEGNLPAFLKKIEAPSIATAEECSLEHAVKNGQVLAGTGALVWEGELLQRED